MPFGLCNAPATFQRLMDAVLGEQTYESLLIYLDDILLFSKTIDQMIDRLDMVFTKLGNAGLKVKPQKCFLFMKEVNYLGHVISERGVETDTKKIEVMRDSKTPKTETELRSFLGLASYYRKFIENFSKIAGPLNALLVGTDSKKSKRKKVQKKVDSSEKLTFEEKWDDTCEKSFCSLKEKLTSQPTLAFPDLSKPFIVETDASCNGLCAVLSQQQEPGQVVIAYASRSLKPSEKNMNYYSSTKLELLALKWAVTDKFREYLLGGKFTVFTDTNPLSYLMTSKVGATEMRWVSELAVFDFEIKFRPGRHNRNADALSRMPIVQLQMVCNSSLLPQNLKSAITEATCVTRLEQIESDKIAPQAYSTFPSNSKDDISEQQIKDLVIGRVLHFWNESKDNSPPPLSLILKESASVKKLLRDWKRLRMVDGVLYRVVQINGEELFQVLLPRCMIPQVLEALHDLVGHQGFERTLALVRQRCFWPGLTKDVELWCKKCEKCLVAKGPKPKLRSKMGSLMVSKPLEILAIDFDGTFS